MDLLSSFRQHLAKKQFFQKKDKLLLAASGGKDSMALAQLLLTCGYSFSLAHMNFQLRGKESDADEQVVYDWGRKNRINVFIKRVEAEAFSVENKMSIQEAAREMRYTWFAALAEAEGFSKILTAHHADDNVETLLHKFFRGTGVAGLTGIREQRGNLVRPLLFTTRQDISTFVNETGIPYREDNSNLTTKYTRNFIRLEVIPLLQTHFPSLVSNLQDTIHRFIGLEGELLEATGKILQKLETRDQGIVKYPARGLIKSPFRIQVWLQILLDSGFHATQLPEFEKLLFADSGKIMASPSHRILKDRRWVVIAPNKDITSEFYIINREDNLVTTPFGNFSKSEVVDFSPTGSRFMEIIDSSQLKYPLILRKWRPGDYFFPLGMKHKKKLSRFFIDEKLSLIEKEKAWVLESDKRIVWVVGLRISERFAIRKNGASFLKLCWQPDVQLSPK